MGEEQNLPMEAIGGARIANFIMGKVNNWRENRTAKQQEEEIKRKAEESAKIDTEIEAILKLPKAQRKEVQREIMRKLGKESLGKWGDDGNFGNTSKAAYRKFREEGHIYDFSKKSKEKSQLISKSKTKPKFNGTYFLSDDDEYIRINWGDGKGSNTGRAKTGDSFYKNGNAAIGHAANLIVKDDGSMYIYEYGRYAPGGGKPEYHEEKGLGNVKYKQLKGLNASQFLKEDGSLDQDTMLNAVSKAHFNNASLSWRKTKQSAEETEALWDELGKNKNRTKYSGFGNNCVSTAARLSGAVQRPLGASAGNDGFWIPVQGQAIAQRITGNAFGNAGDKQYMVNDLTARVWNPSGLQTITDIGNSIYNTNKEYIDPAIEYVTNKGKQAYDWIGKTTGLWKNGGIINK